MTLSVTPEVLEIISGLWGGARYGLKIRLPHALVMTALFRRDLSASAKLRKVLKLSYEHASSLAAFAGLYKAIIVTLKLMSQQLHQGAPPPGFHEGLLRCIGRILISMVVDGPYSGQRLISRAPGQPERTHHALLAGAVGGYLIWGRYSAVNYQIMLYVASRIIVASVKRVQQQCHVPQTAFAMTSFRLSAAAFWGIAMMLFESSPEVLHPSMKRSMDEIYHFNLSCTAMDKIVNTLPTKEESVRSLHPDEESTTDTSSETTLDASSMTSSQRSV